jgi:membrane-associated phospholipid phosphatase
MTYPRVPPARADARVATIGPVDDGRSSFPSEDAAAAGAAEVILAELFPDEPRTQLTARAEEEAARPLRAGAAYRSDIDAGLALGRAVGMLAVARARSDGAARVWDGSGRPSGLGVWQPTPPTFTDPPVDPLAGSWQTWVVERGDQFRPGAPPAYGSLAWRSELAAVQRAVAHRTPEQVSAAFFWAGSAGTVTPAGLWTQIARDLILRDGLDVRAAARVLALTTVAMADAFICCWDAKYSYWTLRSITADPSLDVLFPTPPFPSYTSGHSTVSGAASTVLGYLFPDDEVRLNDQAEEAKDSRLWAGIHYPIDNDVGLTNGRALGRLVIQQAG